MKWVRLLSSEQALAGSRISIPKFFRTGFCQIPRFLWTGISNIFYPEIFGIIIFFFASFACQVGSFLFIFIFIIIIVIIITTTIVFYHHHSSLLATCLRHYPQIDVHDHATYSSNVLRGIFS